MSSIALKFTSLAIRTLSKPIANYIKRQAREHPVFRTTCINFAQTIHRVDMRWRIGLLQDSAALERQAKKDAQHEAEKKAKAGIPTVKTEAETKADEHAGPKDSDEGTKTDKHKSKPKIRPLSEAKAIETGANFISETFLFSVAAGLILFESWRSRRKESNRRDMVADRLNDLEDSEQAARRALIELEREVLHLRAKDNRGTAASQKRILAREVYDPPQEQKLSDSRSSWLSGVRSVLGYGAQVPANEAEQTLATGTAGPAETILKQSDMALDEKHKQQAAEDATAAGTVTKAPAKT